MKKLIYVTMMALVLTGTVAAVDFSDKTGAVGAQFLKIAVGSRYQALGETSVAIVDDAYSMYWNPAGLANIIGSNLTFTNVNWIEDVALNYVSYATTIEDFGSIGLSATLLSMGDMEITTVEEPDGTGQMFSASSFALNAGYARWLTARLAFGASVKYIYEKIYNEHADGFAFDFGTQLHTGYKSLRIGMNISNLGSDMTFSGPDLIVGFDSQPTNPYTDEVDSRLEVEPYDIPLTFRLGLAYDVLDRPGSKWTMAVEATHPNDNDQQASFGTEYGYEDRLFVRGGYKFNRDEDGITLGAGVRTPLGNTTDFLFDYAWSDFGRLDSIHRLSIGFNF